MRLSTPFLTSVWGSCNLWVGSLAASDQQPLDGGLPVSSSISSNGVGRPLFASLERMSRLVDISYCVGTTGISPPFSCASRCKEFPSLTLVQTWNTGALLSDNCGYIAVDHGKSESGSGHPAHEPAIVVAFRGTYSITNTVVDLSTVPQEYVPYPAPGDGNQSDSENETARLPCHNCTVHMGFLASWRSARGTVLPALKAVRLKHPGYPVQLVGHSLGGAVAALAALELKESLGWNDIQVTTFGEPRIGNKGLATYLDAVFGLDGDSAAEHDPDQAQSLPYRRVTHIDDPVPLLPLSEWGFRSHAGEIYISKPELQPSPQDVHTCQGDDDPSCTAGAEIAGYPVMISSMLLGEETEDDMAVWASKYLGGLPARYKLWQLFFAHRDYFWRLGLCVPGGDPSNWGRAGYPKISEAEEL